MTSQAPSIPEVGQTSGWQWMVFCLFFFLPGFFTLWSPEEPNLKSFPLASGALTTWRQGKHLLKMFLPGGWLLPAASVPEECI